MEAITFKHVRVSGNVELGTDDKHRKQYDGDKAGEKWHTGNMNYLIGRVPDIQSLLVWAESRDHGENATPIIRKEVDEQFTVNGVDPPVLGGHLRAFGLIPSTCRRF